MTKQNPEKRDFIVNLSKGFATLVIGSVVLTPKIKAENILPLQLITGNTNNMENKYSFSNLNDRNLNVITIDPQQIEQFEKWQLSEEEWQEKLSEEQFAILRMHKTEPKFSSNLLVNKQRGTYHCAGCDLALFHSDHKFDSKSGWLAFTNSIASSLNISLDKSLIVERFEYHCARCGGHHGHVFPDGEGETFLRYCNNGISLSFKAESG